MIVDSTLVTWGILLVVLVPTSIILLSEIIARLQQHDSVYTRFWQLLRDVALPMLVLFIIVRQILLMDAATTQARLLETIVWVVIAYALGNLLNAIGKAGQDATRWEALFPNLFRVLLRTTIIGVSAYHILSQIWNVPLNDLFAAIGVGSLVIALALQDTLSSIVSGFLLTLDRPFEVGDQISIEGKTGEVLDLNWRSVRVKVNGSDVIVVPNSQLVSQSIYNFTTQNPAYYDAVSIGFSYNNPPNKVMAVLREATASSPYIDPSDMLILLDEFADSSINYLVIYLYPEFMGNAHNLIVRSDVRTRIYYAAQRAGLEIPYPIVTVDQMPQVDVDAAKTQQRIIDIMKANPLFSVLPDIELNILADEAYFETYGQQEAILHQGQPSDGLYILVSGRIKLTPENDFYANGIELVEGSVIGEMIFLGMRPNLATAFAVSDVSIVHIPPRTLNHAIQRFPRFASKLEKLVREREDLLQPAHR